MFVLLASAAFAVATRSDCPFHSKADRQLQKLSNECAYALPKQSPLRLRIGNLAPGTLYTFGTDDRHDFTSWLFVGKRKFVVHDTPDEAGWFTPISIFNVKRRNGYCIVILRVNAPNYLGHHPADEDGSYDGLVTCLDDSGQVVTDERLSRALVNKKTAAAARRALAPLLAR